MKGKRETVSKSLKEKLQSIYSKQDNLPKMIDIPSVPHLSMKEYVAPAISFVDENTGNKRSIKLKNIFDASADQTEVGRVLAEGDVGAGKTTTFLKKIPFDWAKGELFNDQFDYIFRINLKIFTSDWREKGGYRADDLDENPLLSFIHYNLRLDNIDKENRIFIQELTSNIAEADPNRILLVLDGYEILADLKLDSDPVLKQIINEIFEFKYIIATARENSIPLVLRNRFERKIEVEGLKSEGITEYVIKHFDAQVELVSQQVKNFANSRFVQNKVVSFQSDLLNHFRRQSDPNQYEIYEQLIKILGKSQDLSLEAIEEKINSYYVSSKQMVLKFLENPLIQVIATNPVNLVMLCLVCSDIDKYKQNLTITVLYEKFVIWLAKRYVERFGEDTTINEIYSSNEFKVLKLIAFQSVVNSNVLSGRMMDDIAKDHGLTIKIIYKLGLFKSYNSAQKDLSIIEMDHVFDNLSVQDFLAALRFVEILTTGGNKEKQDAANFIAERRNEFKYLGVLKFIAELISTQDSINIFWEAVSCNVDKVTEIGAARKVTLLMHLLGNKEDARIPNFHKIVDFIDEIVLDNLFDWIDVIKVSGYISKKIKDKLLDLFKQNWISESMSLYKIKSLVNVVGSLFNSFNKHEVIEIVNNKLIEENDSDVKKSLIQMYAKIVNGPEIINVVIRFISDVRLGDEVAKIIYNYIQKQSIGAEKNESIDAVFEYFYNIKQLPVPNDANLIELLAKIIDKNPLYIDTFINEVFFKEADIHIFALIKILNYPHGENLKEAILEKFIKYIELLSENNIHKVQPIEAIFESCNDEIINRFFNKLIILLDYNNDFVVAAAASLISKIRTKNEVDSHFVHEAIIKLIKKSEINREDKHFNDALNEAIAILLNKIIDNDELKMKILATFINFDKERYIELIATSSSNSEYLIHSFEYLISKISKQGNKHNIFKAINDITTLSNLEDRVAQKIMDSLLLIVNSSDYADEIKALVSIPISNIIVNYRLRIVYDNKLLILKLVEALYKNSSRDAQRVMDAICKISFIDSESKDLFFNDLMRVSQEKFNPVIIETLSKIGFKEHSQAKEILNQLMLEIKKHKDHSFDRPIAHAIGNLVSVLDNNLQQEVLGLIKQILVGNDKASLPLALYSLGKLVKKNDITKEETLAIFNILINLLGSKNDKILSDSFYVLDKLSSKKVTIIDKQIAQEIFEKIKVVSVRDIKTIGSVASVLNNIINHVVESDDSAIEIIETFPFLVENLQNDKVKIVLSNIVNNMKTANIINLLENDKVFIREVAVQVLLDKTENILVRVQSLPSIKDGASPLKNQCKMRNILSFYEIDNENKSDNLLDSAAFVTNFEEVITILSKNNYDMDVENKLKLLSKARIVARKLIANINEEQLSLVIQDLVRLTDIGGEIKEMMKYLVQVSLKDGIITKAEANFIAYCVKTFDFSLVISEVSFNSENEVQFHILFEDNKIIFKGISNLKNLEYMERLSLLENNDPLAKQIINKKPLFENSQAGIKKAATDIAECPSIVDGAQLDSGDWHCSIMFYSDHKKSFPSNLFMLLGRRVAGYYVADKIFIDDNGEVVSAQRKVYPTDVDIVREDFFGPMEYSEYLKPRYYGLVFQLSLEDGVKIIDAVNEDARDTIFISPTFDPDDLLSLSSDSQKYQSKNYLEVVIDDNASRSIHKIDSTSLKNLSKESYNRLVDFFKNYLPSKIAEIVTKDWSVLAHELREFKKSDLLKVDTRKDSVEVDDREDLASLKHDMKEVQISFRDIQAKLKNVDFPVLEKVLINAKETESVRMEVDDILKSPYQKAFYNALIRSLNGVFVACSSISSGMVKNDDVGSLGNIGSFLSTVSSHTPLVGIGVYFVGQALVGIDQAQQSEKVDNFVRAIRDSNEMCKFAEHIARWSVRELSKQNLKIIEKEKILNKLGGMAGTANDLIDTIAQQSIADVVENVYSSIKQRINYAAEEGSEEKKQISDYLSRFIKGGDDTSQTARGEADAAVVGQIIVDEIFSGALNEIDYESEKIEKIKNNLIRELQTRNIHPIYTLESIDIHSEGEQPQPQIKKKKWWQKCVLLRVDQINYDNILLNQPYANEALARLNEKDREAVLCSKEEGAKFVNEVNNKGFKAVVNEYSLKQDKPLVTEYRANYSEINTFVNHPEIKSVFFTIGSGDSYKINFLVDVLGRPVKVIYKYKSPDGRNDTYVETFDRKLLNENETVIGDIKQFLKMVPFNPLEPIYVDESFTYINYVPLNNDPLTLISDENGFRVASVQEVMEEDQRIYSNNMLSEVNNYGNYPVVELNLGDYMLQQIITF